VYYSTRTSKSFSGQHNLSIPGLSLSFNLLSFLGLIDKLYILLIKVLLLLAGEIKQEDISSMV
jgi:hypothetical protein